MKDMTEGQARAEALKRWGSGGAIRFRPPRIADGRSSLGRLAPYRCCVGNGRLGRACTLIGHGDTWRAAFADVRPVSRV